MAEFWSMRLENAIKLDESKGDQRMNRNQETGTMKIRMKGLEKSLELSYPTMKLKIRYDEKGVAEVPTWVGKKLLGPDYAGSGYEAYTEEVVQAKPERKSKTEKTPEQDFISCIKD